MDLDNPPTDSPVRDVVRIIGAALGIILVGFGLWALGGAIYVAWGLVRDPDGIAYFARYFFETTRIAAYLPSGGEGLAHYLAWVAVILLLLVLGKLGFWAVAAGAALISPRSR